MQKIVEGKAIIKADTPIIVSQEMDVFYNPLMKLNRDIAVLLLKVVKKKHLNVADPLAGSGIRAIRFLKELPKSKIKHITINDKDAKAINNIKANLKLSAIADKQRITLCKKDAKLFLLESKGFDYIDIDPFGSPNSFLDAAVSRISREGIVAITATDTAALAGTYRKTCQRKYWATPLLDESKHETGLRILIRKVQLVAAQYGKALTPIYAYYKDHYLRAFLIMTKGKGKVDRIIEQHGYYKEAGPLWIGMLQDKELAKEIANMNKDDSIQEFLVTRAGELDILGFYDIHALAKKYKLKSIPATHAILGAIRKTHDATRTHFSPTGIKSEMGEKALVKLLKAKSI